MQNQNQKNTGVIFPNDDGLKTPPSLPDPSANNPQALSLEPTQVEPAQSIITASALEKKPQQNILVRLARRADVVLALLLILGSVGLVVGTRNSGEQSNVNSQFQPIEIPLSGLQLTEEGLNFTPQVVTINGALVIAPSLQPSKATAGQIYFDQTTEVMYYFDGTKFIALEAASGGGVQNVGGQSGQINLGGGLNITGSQLNNSGVLSIQGQTGDVTFIGGNGIGINGTTITNTGVVSVTSSTPALIVATDADGNVTLSGSGSGTVSSPGGTVGRVPVFSGSQEISDSLITQSGLTVTVSGDLSVVTGGLSLSNALTVSNGGTGTTSLAANGVIVGAGTGALTSVTAGGSGLCLLSTAGAPNFAVCPSASGVTSLNGLTGALNIANASGAGTTVTIDNAGTVSKGIASFNPTNFTASLGAINTIQDINSGATPTFVGVNTNNITPSAALTVGVSAQTALLQGSTTTITSSGVGNDIILNSADTIELQDNTNVTGNIVVSGDVAANGGDLTATGALNITPGGTLTAGVSGQTLTLQGNASTSLRATDSGNTTIVGFVSPTANTTLNFPALSAGTYTICTSSGNCPSASATLQSAYDNSTTPEIVLDATRGAVTIRDSLGGLGANLLEVQNNAGGTTYLAVNASGIAVTGTAVITGNVNSSGGALQTGGTTRIDNSGNASNIGTLTLSGAISGGTTYSGSGNINTTGGVIQTNSTTRIDNAGNLVNIAALTASGNATFQGGSITLGTAAQQGSVVLHDGNGQTATLSVGSALAASTAIAIPTAVGATDTVCLLTLANCVGTGGGVTGSGTNNQLAKFTSTGSTIGDSSITDDGSTVTTTGDLVIQGGDATIGVASAQTGTLNFAHSGSAFLGSIVQGALTGNRTYTLPDASGTFCNSSGNCLGGGGGANTALSNLTGVAINTTLLPGAAGTVNLGSGTLPFGDVFLAGTSGTPGTNNFRITGASTSGTRVITLPDATGTVCLQSSAACGFAPVSGSASYIQNQTAADQPADFQISGSGIAATFNATTGINTGAGDGTLRLDASGNLSNIVTLTLSGAISGGTTYSGSGNINTTGGGLQTNSTTRVDNGGNLTSIGNITGTAAITIASTGAGNDIVIDGADILDVQDAATFASTLGVTGTTTLSGDAALNGTNISLGNATSDLLTVTAIIQGGSPLIFEGGTADAHQLTLAIATLTGDQTITFPDASGEVCLTIGNCAGAGGGVTTPGGTIGTIPVFTGTQAIGDSLLSQVAGTVTANSHFNLTTGNQYRINGTQISSANLSNDGDIAKLGSSQTFTGATNSFQNGANSTNAFNVQNAVGTRVLTIDTTGGQAVLGLGSTLNGRLVFNNGSNNNTVTIVPGTISGNRTLTLPDVSGIICTDSGNCAGVGATLQTGYNFSTGGTTPKIKVNSTLNGVDIQDADTTIGADLFNIRASNGAGLGSVMFGVGNTGQVTLQNSANSATAFRLLTQGGTSVLTGDTTNGQIILGQSTTLNGTIVFNNATNTNQITLTTAAATGPQTITLPNATGTVCLTSGNCDGAGSTGTLQAAYDAGNTILTSTGRDIEFDLADSATDANFLVDLQCDTACSTNGRFAVQDDGVDIISVTPTSILVGSGTTNVPVTISSGTGVINIGNGAQARAVNVGTGAAAQAVTVGSTDTTSTTLIQSGSGNITLNSGGTIELQDSTNITGALSTTGTLTLGALGTTNTATYLCQNGSNILAACSTTGAGAAFINGGNSFGAAGTLGTNDAFDLNIERGGTTQLTVGSGTVTLASNVDLLLQGATAYISNPQGTTNSEIFGNAASTTGDRNVVIGNTAAAGANSDSVAIGFQATVTDNAVAIGANATCTNNSCVTIGQSTVAGFNAVAIGDDSSANHNNAIALGAGATTTATNQLVVGSSGSAISQVVVGNGVTNATPTGFMLQGTGGSGADIAGASVTIAGGQGTGTGNGGSLIFQIADPSTTGSSLNALSTVMSLSGINGAATFQNSTNSATAFQVQDAAAAGLFTVDTTARSGSGGNLIKIGNSTGTDTATTILQLDGASADPTTNLAALNGGLFYNSTTHKVSLIENGVVKIICNTTDLGCGTGTVTLQNAYANGNTISTTGNDIGFTLNSGQDFTVSSTDASSSVLFSGTTTTGTLLNLANSTAGQTTATLLNVAQSGVTTGFTGNVVNLQGTSTTGTGTLLNLSSANTTNGNALNVTANDVTTGVGVNINSTGTALTTGSLLRITSATTGAINTNGILSLQATGNYTSTSNNGALNVLANSTTAGTIANIQGGALTSGVALNISANTGTAIRVSSGLTTLTNATSGSGTTLNVSNSTSTGSIAVFQDGSTTVASIADGGATLFQNQTNSANAFRILSSSGGEMTGVDTTDQVVRLLGSNSPDLTPFLSTNTLLTAKEGASGVTVNGYIYVLGGCGGTGTLVQYARANSDGTTSPWGTTTALPTANCNGNATTYNGYIYMHGGTSAAGTSDDIYYAKPNSDGTITSWTTISAPSGLPDQRHHAMAAYNGYLYSIGGETLAGGAIRNVYYARINPDGSVGAFTTQSNWMPLPHNLGNTAVVANGYLYVNVADRIYWGKLNANGSVATAGGDVGPFVPVSTRWSSFNVLNGYLYVTGADGVNETYYSPLSNGGAPGTWVQDTTSSLAGDRGAAVSVTINGYIYVVSGSDGAATSTTYYASGPRVKVGGSFDLVGYSGEGLSEGNSGGQLTSGNTYVNGLLSVTGNANLKDGAVIGNNLTVNGLTSFQTTTNSATGFQVLNASAVPQFVVDTSNSRTYIGNPTADTTAAFLVLDTKNDAEGALAGVNGAMYYNSSTQKFRCYQNSQWRDCVSSVEANGITNAAAAGTQATTTYANIPGTSVVNLTKKAAATKLVVNMDAAMFTDTAGSIVDLAIRVDSVDYDCGSFYFNTTGRHEQIACSVIIPSLTAGAKTVQGRWRLDAASVGTPTLTMNTSDWTSITVLETD